MQLREAFILAFTVAGAKLLNMHLRDKAEQASRERFIALVGSTHASLEFQEFVLSSGSEFLPACARAVLEGGCPTPEYWTWLSKQYEKASRTA